jgi:mono/diheme cytochrome c family protein
LGFVVLMAAGCDFPGRPDPADRPLLPDQVLDFRVLYGQNCAGCHGANGKLGPAPPLNDPLFRAIVPVEELESVISQGRAKTLMPAFAQQNGGPLTTAQIQVLVKEIKGMPYKANESASLIAPHWDPVPQPPEGVPPFLSGSTGGTGKHVGNKQRGAGVFMMACAVCHGNDGKGIRQGDETRRAIRDPVFLALISDQELRRFVITGRPDLGMPTFAQPRPDDANFSPLTDQDVTDLVQLLASWR